MVLLAECNNYFIHFVSRPLCQAPCQAELETWVNSIHSACAAAFARHRGKTGTLHLLQEEILRLERSIESVTEFYLIRKTLNFTFFFIKIKKNRIRN